MAETTFTFKDATGATKTALSGANGASQLAPAAVLYDTSGAVLVGRKAASASVPVVISTEDLAALTPAAGGATAANQTTGLTALADILAKLSADPATQTTLAAILAKIIAAPATEAKQDTGNTSLASILSALQAALTVTLDAPTLAALETITASNLPSTVDTNSGNKSASTLRFVLATDQPNLTSPLNVSSAAAASELHLGEVGGSLVQVAATFTRPANTTAYTAGDVVSNDATTTALMSFANFARVNQGKGYIVGARLVTDKKSITPRIRVHLYNASTPTVAGDNVATRHSYADESKRIASFDLPAMTTGTDTTNSDMSQTFDYTIRVPFAAAAATRTIYAVLEAMDAFTPASGQNFSLTLLGDLT